MLPLMLQIENLQLPHLIRSRSTTRDLHSQESGPLIGVFDFGMFQSYRHITLSAIMTELPGRIHASYILRKHLAQEF